MAETLTGDLGSTGWNSTNYVFTPVHYVGWPGGGSSFQPWSIYMNDIENSGTVKSMVWFNTHTTDGQTGVNVFDAGAPSGAQTPVTIYYTTANNQWEANGSVQRSLINFNDIVGTGRIGYQRYFNSAVPPVEQLGGYFYVEMDTWNISTHSGDRYLHLEYNHSAVYNMSITRNDGNQNIPAPGQGTFRSATFYAGGSYTFNKDTNIWASYTVTKPLGLRIQGVVNKTQTGGSIPYNSRAFIFNGSGTTVITSDTLATPNPFFFNVVNEQIKIGILSPDGDWYNTSVLFNITGATPTPTPTPIAGGIYTLSTSTDYVNVSGTNIATIASLTDPSLADLKYIGAYWSKEPIINVSDQGDFFEVGSTVHALSYTKVGGTWYGYDTTDVDYNNVKGAIPNPLTLKWDTTSGDKLLHVTVQNSAGDYTYLTRTIHVGQGTQTLIQTRAQAMDGTNGGNLGMVSMQIYNHNTQTWTNLSPNNGLGTIITPPNTILSFYAQKAGFSNGTLLNQPARSDLIYSINLFTGPAVGAGFSNYFVTVKDSGGFPIGGASIKIINSTTNIVYKQATSSTSGGSQIFNLTASTLYTWTVTNSGYGTQSGSFTSPSSGGSGYLNVILTPAVTPTRTTAPLPTGSWTVNPSYTPSGNMTGFWTPWVNVFTQMGAASDELPLLIAAMLICFCMAAGFGMGGVLGGEVAMGFGAIFCVALGLIPIWVVLAIIILGFLFYGLKIGR